MFDKNTYSKIFDTVVYFINFNEENVVKLINLFDLKTVVTRLCVIEKDSSLFERIKELTNKYYKYESFPRSKNKAKYFDIVLVTSLDDLKNVIKLIFEYNIEMIICQNMINSIDEDLLFKEYACTELASMRELIIKKTSDLYFSIITDEDTVRISFSKDVYEKKQIASKIKALGW